MSTSERREGQQPESEPTPEDQFRALTITHFVLHENAGSIEGVLVRTEPENVLNSIVYQHLKANSLEPKQKSTIQTQVEQDIESNGFQAEYYQTALDTISILSSAEENLSIVDLSEITGSIQMRLDEAKAGEPEKTNQLTATKKPKRRQRLAHGAMITLATLGGFTAASGFSTASYALMQRDPLPEYSSASTRSHVLSEIDLAIQELRKKPPHQETQVNGLGLQTTVTHPAELPDTGAAWTTLHSVQRELSGTGPQVVGQIKRVERILFNPNYSDQNIFAPERNLLSQVRGRIPVLANREVSRENARDTAILKGGLIGLGTGAIFVGSAGALYEVKRRTGRRPRAKR